MKKALVTGGLGFVGTHLVDRLLSEGFQVTIVDSLISNVMQPSDYEASCRVIVGAIEDVARDLFPPAHRFDEIYHLASVVGPAGVLKHSGEIARQVVTSGEAVVELALAHKASLVEVSTSEVYGRAGTFRETDSCIIPGRFTVRLEYAVAKLTSEIAAINRARVTDLHVNIVRPFNIAGPRQLPGGGFVLPRFVIAALTGAPLTVFGTGQQVRAFTDVRDIVSGIVAVMRSSHRSRVFNLGNPANELSIMELAHRVRDVVGSRSPIINVDPKTLFGPLYEEGFDKVPEDTRAREDLSWKPRFTLEDTIRDTMNWYSERPHMLTSLDEQGEEVLVGAVAETRA